MDHQYNKNLRNPNRSLWMENISVLLGLGAIVSAPIVYPALICGSMAIVFALLSKGGERSITARARTGLILGFIALAATVCMVGYFFYILTMAFGGITNLPMDSAGNVDFLSLLDGINAYSNSL